MTTKPYLLACLASVAALPASPLHAAPSLSSGDILAAEIDTGDRGNTIPEGYVGIGFYYNNFRGFMGSSPTRINFSLQNLLGRLAEDQRTTPIRIGGGATSRTWYNPNNASQPSGIEYDVTDTDIAMLKTFSDQTGSDYTLTLNAADGSLELFEDMGKALHDGLGSSRIEQFEIGNEPDLYFWKDDRPEGWNYDQFEDDFDRFINRFKSSISSSIDVVGPTFTMTSPESVEEDTEWNARAPEFIGRYANRLNGYSMNRYPSTDCSNDPKNLRYPSIGNILDDRASLGQADALDANVFAAKAAGLRFVISEHNTASCGGRSGVSDRFASALWFIDSAFAYGAIGVDQLFVPCARTDAYYSPFLTDRTGDDYEVEVKPLFYGMALFAEAAPAGSRILNVEQARSSEIRAWGTVDRDGVVRVAIVNKDQSDSGNARITIPGATQISVARLTAPKLSSKDGVEYAEQTYDGTDDGIPRGSRSEETYTSSNGVFVFSMPKSSGALVTVGGQSSSSSSESPGGSAFPNSVDLGQDWRWAASGPIEGSFYTGFYPWVYDQDNNDWLWVTGSANDLFAYSNNRSQWLYSDGDSAFASF